MSVIALVLAALVGCGGEAADQAAGTAVGADAHAPAADGAAPTEAAPAEAAPAAAAAGTAHTKAQLDEAAALVFPMQPWTEAEAALKAKLGDAQKTEGDITTWFAKEGETCTALTVQKMGDAVGTAAVGPSNTCP